VKDRFDYYNSLSDEELEAIATDRARQRDATFSVDEHPAGKTFRAAYTQPSPIEEGELVYLASAETVDRRLSLIALLWQDNLLAGKP